MTILSLNFSSNIISVVEKFTFSGLNVLKVLDLSNNKINSLNIKSFTGLINMIFLKINQNPLENLYIFTYFKNSLSLSSFIQIILDCVALNQD